MPAAKKSPSARPAAAKKRSAKSAGKNAPITLEKATAEEIRTALGITPTAMRIARKALYKASQAKKSSSVSGRGKGKAAKRSTRGHGTKKQP
jgi:hypothetical protein